MQKIKLNNGVEIHQPYGDVHGAWRAPEGRYPNLRASSPLVTRLKSYWDCARSRICLVVYLPGTCGQMNGRLKTGNRGGRARMHQRRF